MDAKRLSGLLLADPYGTRFPCFASTPPSSLCRYLSWQVQHPACFYETCTDLLKGRISIGGVTPDVPLLLKNAIGQVGLQAIIDLVRGPTGVWIQSPK